MTAPSALPGPEAYLPRYQLLLDDIQRDLRELAESRQLERARELSESTGQHFNHNELPMYFTGDPDASFVLVLQNPKHDDNDAAEFNGEVPTFETYFRRHRYFGHFHYGPTSPRTHRSPTDEKQVEFLRPFGVIDFRGEKHVDLERAIDGKLQMELIPYGSSKFPSYGFTDSILQPHYERLLSVIEARSREYVFFCGTALEPLLRRFVVNMHTFHLTKGDGTRARDKFRFASLRLPFEGKRTLQVWLTHIQDRACAVL